MELRNARSRTRTWPRDFESRRGGRQCSKCTEGRPDDDGNGLRIFTGALSDAYLQRHSQLPGWTSVTWRGRHVAEPMDLEPADASTYWNEVLQVASALRQYFRPIKVNIAMHGNVDPHLHAHIILRFEDDVWPARPIELGQFSECYTTAEYEDHIATLRKLLANTAAYQA